MENNILILNIIFAILVAFSAYFSASETAFSSLSIIRLEAKLKSKKNHHAIKLYKKYTETLSVILIANNIVNISAASVSLALFNILDISNKFVWSTIFTTLIILIFGEFLPKVFAKRHPEAFVIKFSLFLFLLEKLVSPFTFIIGKFARNQETKTTEAELMSTVVQVAQQGEIEKSESILINSALKFDDTKVKSIFTKWSNVSYIHNDATVSETLKVAQKSKHTRIPVLKGIYAIGYISVIDLIGSLPNTPITKKIRRINFISQNVHLDDALELIQRRQTHILIVTKNQSSQIPIGIITLEDLIENIVGEIYDETDTAPNIIPVGHSEFIINGSANVADVFKYIKGETPYVKNISFTKWVISNMSQKNIEENKFSRFQYDKFTISWIEKKRNTNFFKVTLDE